VILTDGVPDDTASMSQEIGFLVNHLGVFLTADLIGADKEVHHFYNYMDGLYERFDSVKWYEYQRDTVLKFNPWLKYHFWVHIKCLAGHFGDVTGIAFDSLNETHLTLPQIISVLHHLYPHFRMPLPSGALNSQSREHFEDALYDAIADHDTQFIMTEENNMLNVDPLLDIMFPEDECSFGDRRNSEFFDRYSEIFRTNWDEDTGNCKRRIDPKKHKKVMQNRKLRQPPKKKATKKKKK